MSVKYKVIATGFYGGCLYEPNGKRSHLVVDKEFTTCPKWLEKVGAVSAEKVTEEGEKSAPTKVGAVKKSPPPKIL